MDELLQQVAELRGMPASLVERSAQAKADKTGTTLEAVLRDWAGDDAPAESPTSQDAPAQAEAPEAADAAPDTPGTTVVTTDYLVQLASDTKRMPPKLILSSAQARATHSGKSLDTVLADWAGVDLDELKAGATATPPAPEAATPPPEPAPAATPEPAAAPAAAPVAAAAAVAAGALTMDQLLEKVAEVKGMPAPLAKRSAQARSKKTGEPLEAVLAEWAGIDPASVSTAPAQPATPEPAAAPAAAPVAAAAAVAAGALTMDQLLEKVAEVKGMPAPLAKRSAQARSKKTGEPLEAVLAEWAGIDPASVSTAPAQPATPEPAAAPAAAPVAAADESGGADVEIIEASQPDTADVPDSDDEPPSKRGGYPIWLAAAFILIPLLAVVYILVSPNGPDCGSGGQLRVDSATGEAVNCDGSQYGIVTVDNFAAGGSLYQQCAACHSNDGTGGVGPAFSSGAILATFPAGSCATQIEWVSVGTSGWPESTYGATNKPVGGVGLMPGFAASLTEEQVAQVALYERVAFGGQDLADAEVDCGLVEADS